MLADDAFLYHLHRGTELLLQERVDEARQSLEQALRLQPEDIEGQSLLAAVYFRLGLYQRAIESWLDLAERYPQSATLHVNLALSWLKCGDFERAVAAAEQALAQQPEHRRAWRYAGLAHWRLGHLEEAKHALTQADAHQLIAHIEAERLAASHPGAAGDADASAPIAAASPQDLGLAAAQAEAQLRDWPSPLWLDPHAGGRRRRGPWSLVELALESPTGTAPAAPPLSLAAAGPVPPPDLRPAQPLAAHSMLPRHTGITDTGALQLVLPAQHRLLRRRHEATAAASWHAHVDASTAAKAMGTAPAAHWTTVTGPGHWLWPAPPGAHFLLWQLQGETLWLRPAHCWGLDAALVCDDSMTLHAALAEEVLGLQGTGLCVLQLPGPVHGSEVTEAYPLELDARLWVAWQGTVRWEPVSPAPTPRIQARGQGRVWWLGSLHSRLVSAR